jgi:cytochrome c oxidase subunit 4
MADTKHADAAAAGHHDGGGHHGNLFKIYMIVAIVLAVATASSFLFNWLGRPVEYGGAAAISRFVAFALILTVAIVKATLVGMYFMHLKWDWKLLYFLIIPAFILGAMMMVVFMPDILLGHSHDLQEDYEMATKVQP